MLRSSIVAIFTVTAGWTASVQAQGPLADAAAPGTATSVTECARYVEQTASRMRETNRKSTESRALQDESIRLSKECAKQFQIKSLSGEDLITLARLFIGARQDDKATEALNRYVSLAKTDADRATALATAASPLTGYGYASALPSRSRQGAIDNYLGRLEEMGDVALGVRIRTFRSLVTEAPDMATQRRYLERAMKAIDRQVAIGQPEPAVIDALAAGAATAALQCELEVKNSCQKIDGYLERLGSRPDSLAYPSMVDAYWEAGNAIQSRDEQIRYFERALALLEKGPTRDPAPKTTLATAMKSLATAYGRLGNPDKMAAILERAARELEDGLNVVSTWRGDLDVYTLVGKPAPAIGVTYWLGGKKDLPLEYSAAGKPVTLIEFTAHYCGPCTQTYPSIREMQRQYGESRLEAIFFTKIYGFFANEEGLSVDEELKRDREYWFGHYQMALRIGLTETPVHTDTANPTIGMRKRARWQDDYFVDGVPTVVLVDRQGIVRLAMTGYLESLVRRKVHEMIELDGKK